ncbi:MAG: RNA methyltransferase, partial [Acidimicrobiaceae bacterium]|nr:RNA methyltransferase [Acidimicrobiaceae bacterium]
MHAKVSKSGLRFFAHDRVSPDCPSNGETAAHRELKAVIAATARAIGLEAEIEA